MERLMDVNRQLESLIRSAAKCRVGGPEQRAESLREYRVRLDWTRLALRQCWFAPHLYGESAHTLFREAVAIGKHLAMPLALFWADPMSDEWAEGWQRQEEEHRKGLEVAVAVMHHALSLRP